MQVSHPYLQLSENVFFTDQPTFILHEGRRIMTQELALIVSRESMVLVSTVPKHGPRTCSCSSMCVCVCVCVCTRPPITTEDMRENTHSQTEDVMQTEDVLGLFYAIFTIFFQCRVTPPRFTAFWRRPHYAVFCLTPRAAVCYFRSSRNGFFFTIATTAYTRRPRLRSNMHDLAPPTMTSHCMEETRHI